MEMVVGMNLIVLNDYLVCNEFWSGKMEIIIMSRTVSHWKKLKTSRNKRSFYKECFSKRISEVEA